MSELDAYKMIGIHPIDCNCISCKPNRYEMPPMPTDRDTAPQPPPIPTDSEPIYKLVMADIEAKAQVGREKYGTYLQADNGRDHLADAYQEGIDGIKYLKCAIVERRALLDRIAALEGQLAEAQARLAMAVEALEPIVAAWKTIGTWYRETSANLHKTKDVRLSFEWPGWHNRVDSTPSIHAKHFERLADFVTATAVAEFVERVERRGAIAVLVSCEQTLRENGMTDAANYLEGYLGAVRRADKLEKK